MPKFASSQRFDSLDGPNASLWNRACIFLATLGFVTVTATAVALAIDCPPNSHSDGGNNCRCDTGYVAKDGHCVPG